VVAVRLAAGATRCDSILRDDGCSSREEQYGEFHGEGCDVRLVNRLDGSLVVSKVPSNLQDKPSCMTQGFIAYRNHFAGTENNKKAKTTKATMGSAATCRYSTSVKTEIRS
jgi:hypothetical protein